jgi:hypothetical protein
VHSHDLCYRTFQGHLTVTLEIFTTGCEIIVPCFVRAAYLYGFKVECTHFEVIVHPISSIVHKNLREFTDQYLKIMQNPLQKPELYTKICTTKCVIILLLNLEVCTPKIISG